jgi:predicted MFS family arabinose efflux permease
MMSERYGARRWPLIIGLLALVASQIMFMEAPSYAVLCVARFIQGVSSSVVWIIGLALLCDCVPERNIGRTSARISPLGVERS